MKLSHVAIAIAVLVISAGIGFFIGSYDSGPEMVDVEVITDNGAENVIGEGEYPKDSDIFLKVVIKDGYVLEGWYDSNNNLLSKSDTITLKADNATYFVKTSRNVTVTLEGDYGIVSTSGSGTYAMSDDIIVDCVLKPGFHFKGWYLDGKVLLTDKKSATIPGKLMTNKDVTVIAKSIGSETVKLQLRNGPGVEKVKGAGSYIIGEEVRISATIQPGYVFEGWYDSKGKLVDSRESVTVYAENKTLTAKAVHNPEIKIELHGDAGIADTYQDEKLYKGTKVVFGADLRPGYSFDAWYDASGKKFTDWQWTEIIAEEDLILYGKTVPEYTYHALAMSGVDSSGKKEYGLEDLDSCLYCTECQKGCFIGWYNLDGKLMETSRYYKPNYYDGVYIAKTTIDDYSGNNILRIDGYPEWYNEYSYCIILDSKTKNYVTSFVGKDCPELRVADGKYDICYYNGWYDKSAEYEIKTKTFNNKQTYNFYWTFNGRNYGSTWEIDNATFNQYHDSILIPHNSYDWSLKQLCDYDDPLIVSMADFLYEKSKYMCELDRANFVLKFVQHSTEYELDENYNGKEDYAKHPIMTLLEGRGDCEDTAILYATLMKAMGYDVMLLDYTGEQYIDRGHVATGVRINQTAYGTYYEHNGGKYFYCETTSNEHNVGDGWDEYDYANFIEI